MDVLKDLHSERYALGRMGLQHELWEDVGGEYSLYTFCLAGPQGDESRRDLSHAAKLIWTIDAESHFEAMSKYYKYMDWGTYTSEFEWDHQPYPQEWYDEANSRNE